MRTILFFDRCNAPYLSARLLEYIGADYRCVFVAYSNIEASIYESFGISNYIIYQDRYNHLIKEEQKNEKLLEEIDSLIVDETNGRFNLNLSLQSDRSSQCLSYEEALLAAQVHYKIWSDIFREYKVDILYHEPCSHYFNHIAALLCKKQGGLYCSLIQSKPESTKYAFMAIEGDNYYAAEVENNYNRYIQNPSLINLERCKAFLEKFRSDYSVFFGNEKKQEYTTWGLWKLYMKEKLSNIRSPKINRILQPLDYWVATRRVLENKYKNWKQYKNNHVIFESELPDGEKYFYYSMHLEPEAVVLYWGGGIYSNQIKLIENIASSLPPGYYLYVKDHPHEFAYRKSDDYERLMNVPNIRLIDRTIPGKNLIKNAVGVFSINGTAGFEALLLGKQTYCFGNSYYSFLQRVNYIENIRDLRRKLYENLTKEIKDDTELYAFINAYLDSIHSGYADFACADPCKFISEGQVDFGSIVKAFERLLEIQNCINE